MAEKIEITGPNKDDTAAPCSGNRSGWRMPKTQESSANHVSPRARQSEFHFSFKPSMRKRNTTMEDFIVRAGETCETVSIVTVRSDESLDSDMIAELQVGTACEILRVGQGRRAEIKSGDIRGWISIKTKSNEPLLAKKKKDVSFRKFDFEVGGQHEVKSMITVRAAETLDSEVLTELKPGDLVKILEISAQNKRRAYIHSEGHDNGWISLATKAGELLVGNVTEGKSQVSEIDGASNSKIKFLLECARSGDLEGIKRLVEGFGGIMTKFSTRPSLNSSDIRGKTALIYAAAFGHKDIVEYLVSKREVDVNALDDTQKSALHHASKRARRRREDFGDAQAEILNCIIQAGAYIEGRDHNGCTALMFAVANGDELVTKELLKAGANVNVKDFEGHTPLDYTHNFGHESLTNLLKSFGAVGEESDEEGEESIEHTEMGPGTDAATVPRKKPKRKLKKEDKDNETQHKVGKAKAKAKPRGKAKARAAMKMAEEMALAGGREADIQVEIDAADQERALANLQSIMECSSTSPDELDGAIKVAVAAAISEDDLAAAKQHLEKLRAKARAITLLHSAMDERVCAPLREAIELAKENDIPDYEIENAQAVLAVEEPKEHSHSLLVAALDAGDADAMREALVMAKHANLDPELMLPFQQLLHGAESKAEAEATLKKAVADKEVAQLKFAIQQAKEAGLMQGAIANAERVLAVEEPKQRARDLIASILENPNETDLRAAIQGAKDAGLEPHELVEAEQAVELEIEKKASIANLQVVMETYADVSFQDFDALTEAKIAISAAIGRCKAVKVGEADVVEAEARRRKVHNGIEDLKGSIRVFCRIRPLSKKEKDQGDHQITEGVDPMTLNIQIEKNTLSFQFDAVHVPGTQEAVFEDCKDLVQSAVDGYNVTIFAYGQTGAGKTFTMAGVPGNLGVSPRTIQEVFHVIDARKERCNYTVMGSMVELYRNDFVDLLIKDGKNAAKRPNVRQDKTGAVLMEHLTEEECADAEQLEKVLDKGNTNRTVAATAMNSESSRSHLVLFITIVSVNKETKEQVRGKILICDLAGSERLKKSLVTADMQKEAIEINKSLTALGDVIQALTLKQKQVPYRNHKLTQLMQDSLGGSAKTLMFVNCSPANSNTDETLMSLKYAQRAKYVTNTHIKRQEKVDTNS